jgi:hypothetical protein
MMMPVGYILSEKKLSGLWYLAVEGKSLCAMGSLLMGGA